MSQTPNPDALERPRRVIFSLGANVGDTLQTLRQAIELLDAAPGLELSATSSIYRTAPVGNTEQPYFLNLIAVGDTVLPAPLILKQAQEIEDALGRIRRERWGPRTIDIDLIDVGGMELDTPSLTLPHPRAHERAFVLMPWLEVDPSGVLVGHGRLLDLLAQVDISGVERVGDPMIGPA